MLASFLSLNTSTDIYTKWNCSNWHSTRETGKSTGKYIGKNTDNGYISSHISNFKTNNKI